MCGISVIFELKQDSQNGKPEPDYGITTGQDGLVENLNNSVEQMRHRGPDAKGIWTSSDNNVGLAHVRLSTRDLSPAGHQPLHSVHEADDIHIVVNGELYYEAGLREALEKEYKFQSTSDSEMVIPLYMRYGPDFIHHLRGEFSLAVYDGKTQTLVVARDRFGVKPLHYGIFAGKLLVATQCKGVAGLMGPSHALTWDVQNMAQGGGHYGNRTFFEGIRKVPQGHIAVVRQGQNNPVEFKPYYAPKYPANFGGQDMRTPEELIAKAHDLLLESVRIRLESTDVPVGILLSGGVDSSTVAGMAARVARERLESTNGKAPPLPTCFTIAFPEDDELDESNIAARTAAHLGLPLETLVVTEQMFADEFDDACWLGEALMWDLQHIAKKALSKYISSRGFKVVLNGDGGDELFGGYPFFASDRLLEDDKQHDKSLQEATTADREAIQTAAQVKWFGADSVNAQRGMSHSARALNLPPAFCNYGISTHEDWLIEEVRQLDNPFDAIYECFDNQEKQEMATYHPLRRAMLAWNKTVLPNMVISAISDGAEMAHGVESRPPFLDHVLAEFVNSLPPDMLVRLEGQNPPIEKWLFRQAARRYITDEVYERRKHAFAAPFKWRQDGVLYKKLSSLINADNMERLGFVDASVAEDIFYRAFRDGDQTLFSKAIWFAQIISIGLQFKVQKWVSPFEGTRNQ